MSARILAGDVPQSTQLIEANGDLLIELPATSTFQLQRDTFRFSEHVTAVEKITEENKTSIGAKFGWGVAGLALFGPLGGATAAIVAGNYQQTCIVCTFRDGRKAMLLCSLKTYQGLLAATMKASSPPDALAAAFAPQAGSSGFGILVAATVAIVVAIAVVAMLMAS